MAYFKRVMALVLTLGMVFSMIPVQAFAAEIVDSGTCGDNLTWTLSGDGVLTISGSGKMEDYLGYSANRPPWYGSIDSIKTCILEAGVESIGDYALAFARKLQSVSIPNTVTSIGSCAFYYCNSMSNIVIPSSVEEMGSQIFKGCNCLGSAGPIGGGYDIEFGWKEMIPNYAFSSCTSLQSIYIPNGVYTIGDGAFNECSNLKNVIVPNTVTSIGTHAFNECVSLSDFAIPDKVTYIGPYAFSRCTSLESITIPDGITGIESGAFSYNQALIDVTIPDCVTYIGNGAFKECTGLTTVSIGSGVTSIRFGAFSGCSKLRDIYFTGSAPDFELSSAYRDGVFERVTATAYYPADNSTWTPDVMQNYSGTITWVPYYHTDIFTSIYGRSGEDLLLIYPLELGSLWSSWTTLRDVTISSSLGEVVHPKDGYFIHRADASARDMVLSKEGYRDYILPAEVSRTLIGKEDTAYTLSAYMQKDTKDGKPYISTVFGRVSGSGKPYTDLRVTALAVKENAASDIIISAVGFGNQEVTYVIAQDSLHKTSNTSGVFSAAKLFDLFDDTGTVYAYAVGSDGNRTEPMEIKIDRQEAFDAMEELGIDSELSLLGKDFFKIKVSDDVPVVGGTELDMSAFTFPVGVTVEGDDVKISLGIDLFSSTENEDGYKWKTFKDLVIKHTDDNTQDIEEFCKDYELAKGKSWKTTKKANKFDMNVLGYVEGRFVNGEFVVKEGQLNLGGKFMFQYTAQGAVWVVPVYGSFEAGSDFSVGGKLTRFMPDKDFPFEFSLLLNITPQIKGKAGVGIKDAASAGLYAEGKMPLMIAFQEEHLTLDLKGEIGVEAELFILHASKPLLEGTTNLIDWYYGTSVSSVSLADNSTTDISSTVVSRDYLAMTSGWLGDEKSVASINAVDSNAVDSNAVAAEGVTFRDLQTSVFSNSQPQLVAVGDQMLLVWVEDDASRDTYNRMRLVFSVYDPVTDNWSAPESVWDNGYNDGYPRLAVQGENIYVLWQKINTTLTAENTTSPDTTLENSELCLAKFDTSAGTFVDAQMITNNSMYEYAHNMVLENGKPVVYWAVADENAMNESNANSLYRWEDGCAESIAENLNYVLSIDAAGGDVTYVADADSNLSDTTDVTAFTISTSGTESFVNSELDAAVTYASYSTLAGENILFLSDMRNIYYEQNGIVKSVLAESRIMGGNLNIVETDLGTTILWTETVEGWNELYAVTYRSGVWSEPVMLSEQGELLSKISAVSYNGKLTGVCNTNAVVYDDATGEYVKENTDLVLFQVNDFSDIALDGCLSFNESELEPGTETQLKVMVYNNGTTDVNNITFEITDTLGTKSVQSVAIDIPSGCGETVDLTYCVPQNYTTTILTVTAQIADNDADASDNTISLEIGNQDLSVMETAVEMLQGGYLLKTIVQNSSLVDAENVVLSVFADEEGSEQLQSVIIGTITRDNYALAEILLNAEALNYSENGAAKIYVKLTADGRESSAADNLICIVVAKAETTVCMHPVSDMVAGLDPNCTEAGYECEICAACNEVIGETKELPPLGHNMGQWRTIKEHTCTETGTKQRVCSRCDHAETEEVPAKGHDYTATVTEPTCTWKGYTIYECSGCGDWDQSDFTEPLGHSCVEGVCKRCGVAFPATGTCGKNAHWKLEESGVLTVYGTGEMYDYTSNWDSNSDNAPWGPISIAIMSVIIEDGVTTVGNSAFAEMPSINKVVIGDSVISIGERAFERGCSEVTLGKNVNSIGYRAFSNCSLRSIVIPSSVEFIDTHAFVWCTELEEIVFQGDAPKFGDDIFLYVGMSVEYAVAYYPADNPTWTSDVLREYGGNIVWVEYSAECTEHIYQSMVTNPTCTEQGYTTYTCTNCGDSYVDNYTDPVDHVYVDGYCKWCGQGEQYVKWYSGTTSLNGTIDLNIYVLLSQDLVNADDTYVRFIYDGNMVDVPMADALHSPTDTAPNRYRFSCPIYAKQLADNVTVKFLKGEQQIGKDLNYSVVTYCVNQIKKVTDPQEVALYKAMLNYGAAAQKLFGHNLENLANASLSEADKVLPTVDASAYKYAISGKEEGIRAKSATLMLEDVVKVRVYFALTGTKTIEDYTFTIDGEEVAVQQNDKGYYVESSGIAAKDLEHMFSIQVGSITVKYGALSYVNSMANGTKELEANISKALYVYWQAAEALLG